jgi:membrane-associated phospholipid phosphatase
MVIHRCAFTRSVYGPRWPGWPPPPLRYRDRIDERTLISRSALRYAAGFVVLAMLVEATDFDRLNAFAVRHLQPFAAGKGHPRLNAVAELVVSPAAPTTAALVIVALAAWLWLKRRRAEALAWPAALVAAYAVELGSKLVIGQHRSGVWHGYGLTLDSSFPSGHMLRAILLTGAVSALWPRLRRPLVWWCAAVAVCLLVSGWHLPTDIVGGILAGLALQRWAQAVAIRRPVWWWASSPLRPAAPAVDPPSTSDMR